MTRVEQQKRFFGPGGEKEGSARMAFKAVKEGGCTGNGGQGKKGGGNKRDKVPRQCGVSEQGN